ncbi:MAG: transcription antitermination factor NusB [Clostridia bacterium]|nr:transcription antitermination factor NusB [Clostridia bacterium]
MVRRNAREAAMRMLYDYDMHGSDGQVIFEEDAPHVVDVRTLGDADREYLDRISQLLPESLGKVDEVIEANSKNWRFERISKVDLAILRLALLEIMYLEVPPKLAVNEAVELAKKYSTDKAYKFVNGLLGGYLNSR